MRFVLVLLLALGATVSRSPFCIGAEMAQQQPAPNMPPEGNPDDVTPPEGAFCSRSPKPEHSCKCHAVCIHDDKGRVTGIKEDPKCRAWCHADRCRCPADCE